MSIGSTQNSNRIESCDEKNTNVPPKNLKRITSYVLPELAEALEEWAKIDERSVSWLASKLIEKGV
jgi:CopG-like RHH_1 or ribbon-helix-helix domain, RHH_5